MYGTSVIFPNQVELEEAADLVLFLMDHSFLADDHLALNETTFTWPDRIFPIIKMRYVLNLNFTIAVRRKPVNLNSRFLVYFAMEIDLSATFNYL